MDIQFWLFGVHTRAVWLSVQLSVKIWLLFQTDKVDRLEADNHRFKEKLRDLDYYKKRAEVSLDFLG